MWTLIKRSIVRVALVLLVAAPWCGPCPAAGQPKSERIAGLPADALLPAIPAGAMEIADAMKTARAGETLTVRGRVAPGPDAFAADRAVFTLVDDAAVDRAPASGESDRGSRCTVRFNDASGDALRTPLSGKAGLKAGAEVFVTGKVLTANGTDALVIEAIGMHIPKASLPAGFFLRSAPEGKIEELSALKKAGSVKAGDSVILRGRVGGSVRPFVAGRAVMTLVGSALKACNEKADDACKTPWDYCCDTREEILANSATIQVVDDKGQILRTDLKGRRGLGELATVTVVGTVAVAKGQVLVVNATGLHVDPR